MKHISFLLSLGILFALQLDAQMLRLPENGVNLKNQVSRTIGVTDIAVRWNAPGVKGRSGNIWGTSVAHFGFVALGYGSSLPSPWRAGANESTTISFSTDVTIAGKLLAAGEYGFFIALYEDSCMLIFSNNTQGWGSYFYDPSYDALRVTVRQEKNRPILTEWLSYSFVDQTSQSLTIALDWEYWRIPIPVTVNVIQTGFESIREQLSGGMGFDPPGLQAGAQWCLTNDVHLEQALEWINRATDPELGNVRTFSALNTKAGILEKLGQKLEADALLAEAMSKGTVLELHAYGRQLIAEKKYAEAMAIFEMNAKRHGDTWPVHVGLMRGYSATGQLKKALEHAQIAIRQAPDEQNKKSLEGMLKTLQEGKALVQ
ncbi:MAG: DUF2911 domain-containing protein [Saprospiraceae bacterium]|nr:DUF2911 domain-containing protein [Saprospiraceae bacterium]